MIITYFGHALFSLETAGGATIVTDPYDASVGYSMGSLAGDVVTVSHEHHDHNNVELVEGSPEVIRGEGVFSPALGVRITGFPAFHDDSQGTRRGKNTLFLIEAEGLRVLHLGDLGHLLSEEVCRSLRPVDVMMLPVGGYYTIDANQAGDVIQALSPRIVIPMHYRTIQSAKLPIAPAEDFLNMMGVAPTPMPLLRVMKEDLSQQPHIALLNPKPLPVAFRG